MTSKNLETFRRLTPSHDFDIEQMRAHQEAIRDCYTDDYVVVEPPSLPYGGVYQGRQAIDDMHAVMKSLWQQHLSVDEVIDVPEKDLIVLRSTMEWTARATGRAARVSAVQLLWFRDARICRAEVFLQDTKLILDTLDPEQEEGSSMGATENFAVHVEWTNAEAAFDLSHHRDYVHEDLDVHGPGGTRVVGVEGYTGLVEASYATLENYEVIVDDRFATDDRVVCRWRIRGILRAELPGAPAVGEEVEQAGMSLWVFDGGKARRGWFYVDGMVALNDRAS